MPAQKTKPAPKPKTVYGEREDGALSGNLTRDPELRYTPSGRPVSNFAIAVNSRFQDDSGEWQDAEPEFWEITVWGQQAENACECLSKSDRAVMTGYFQDETYTNKEGEQITRCRFTAQDIGPSLLFREARIMRPQKTSSKPKSRRQAEDDESPF